MRMSAVQPYFEFRLISYSLHSAEAVQLISKYQIGVIVGPWRNFAPPVQGGHFRTAQELATLEEQTRLNIAVTSSSDDDSSDVYCSDSSGPGVRQRKRMSNSSLSSISSATSVSAWDDLDVSEKQETSFVQKELEADLRRFPSLDAVTQADIATQFRTLRQHVEDAGLFDCSRTAYAGELLRYVLLFGSFLYALHHGWYCTSAIFLGVFWHQLVFTAHDAGHMGITHKYHVDTVIGIIIADFMGGLSLGWWKRSHNVHHVVTNSPEHDPDIELMPFFAITTSFFNSLRSTYHDCIMSYDAFAKVTVQYQHYLYYPILLLGRFNLYLLSWHHIYNGLGPRKGSAAWHRWLELAGQVFFWIWYGYAVIYKSIPNNTSRLAFILISNMVTMPLHVQITLSHFAMSTSDLGVEESFPQKMLRTTMDVDCPQWLDFVHGGLQFQAIHHLFPRMPRHNLRRAQKLVQNFCQESGIPYALYGFTAGNKKVLGRLGEVAQQASVLAECQRSMMMTDLHSH